MRGAERTTHRKKQKMQEKFWFKTSSEEPFQKKRRDRVNWIGLAPNMPSNELRSL
jgi:hypothetical protein